MDDALPVLEDDTFRRVPPPRVRQALEDAGLSLAGPGPTPGWAVRAATGAERLVSLAVGTVPGRRSVVADAAGCLHPVLDVLPAGDDEVLVHPPLAGRRLRTFPVLGVGIVAAALVAAARATTALHEAGLGLGVWELGDVVQTAEGDLVVWVPSPVALGGAAQDDVRALVGGARELLARAPDGDPAAAALWAALDGLAPRVPEELVHACLRVSGPPGIVEGEPLRPARRAARRSDLAALRRDHVRRPRRVVVGVVAAGLLVGTLGGAVVGRALREGPVASAADRATPPGAGADAASVRGTAGPGDPASAAQTLTARRVALLAQADEAGDQGLPDGTVRAALQAGLDEVHAPGSELAAADAALLADLLDGAADVEHVAAQARSARITVAGEEPVVEVVYAMAARDGSLHERVALLRLSDEGGAWRVAGVVARE
ncbi:hypothetical protein SAMN04488035_1482 [Flavimobilis marinus]|uniref:Uncharacterized protein n=1 Tax=Flavimobilis marinus TaxID=285351 RepID=A0A1I2FRD5_9MICO|nr:hypothetical protein [Flavimobilis marinus]SFF08012.1 hypothetical protein SAMN04488035_1482 [Flavimobilis marinus]